MKKLTTLFVTILILSYGSTLNAEVRVQIGPEKQTVEAGESFEVEIKMYLSEGDKIIEDINAFDFPGIEQFEPLTSSFEQQSQTRVINGVTEQETAYIFYITMRSLEPGTFTIGPFSRQTTSGTVSSNVLEIEVIQTTGSMIEKAAKDYGWKIGVIFITAIAVTTVAAFIKNAYARRYISPEAYDQKALQEHADLCETPDDFFLLMQDMLAHKHGDHIRSMTGEELKKIEDTPSFKELLRLLDEQRYTSSEKENVTSIKKAFRSYLKNYDS